MREYNSIIQDQLQKGITESVDPSGDESTRVHYLPHHAVIRQDKETTKVQIVYDDSAKSEEGLSLNDCLFTGQKFDQKILDILIHSQYYEECALEMHQQSKDFLRAGGFKVVTNVVTLQEKIDGKMKPDLKSEKHVNSKEDEAYSKTMLDSSQKILTEEQKVIGVHWSTSFYDPLGFISLVIVHFKVLFQEFCQARMEWDHPLTRKSLKKWQWLITSFT